MMSEEEREVDRIITNSRIFNMSGSEVDTKNKNNSSKPTCFADRNFTPATPEMSTSSSNDNTSQVPHLNDQHDEKDAKPLLDVPDSNNRHDENDVKPLFDVSDQNPDDLPVSYEECERLLKTVSYNHLKTIAKEIDISLKVGNKPGKPKIHEATRMLATEICVQLQWTKIELMKNIMPSLGDYSFNNIDSKPDQKPSKVKPTKQESLSDIPEKQIVDRHSEKLTEMFKSQQDQHKQQLELIQQNQKSQEKSQSQTSQMILKMMKEDKEDRKIREKELRIQQEEDRKIREKEIRIQQEGTQMMLKSVVELVNSVVPNAQRKITDGTVSEQNSLDFPRYTSQNHHDQAYHQNFSQQEIQSTDKNYYQYADDRYTRTNPYFSKQVCSPVTEYPTTSSEPERPRKLIPIRSSAQNTSHGRDHEDQRNNNKRRRNNCDNQNSRYDRYFDERKERSRERSIENPKKYIRTESNDGKVQRQ